MTSEVEELDALITRVPHPNGLFFISFGQPVLLGVPICTGVFDLWLFYPILMAIYISVLSPVATTSLALPNVLARSDGLIILSADILLGYTIHSKLYQKGALWHDYQRHPLSLHLRCSLSPRVPFWHCSFCPGSV